MCRQVDEVVFSICTCCMCFINLRQVELSLFHRKYVPEYFSLTLRQISLDSTAGTFPRNSRKLCRNFLHFHHRDQGLNKVLDNTSVIPPKEVPARGEVLNKRTTTSVWDLKNPELSNILVLPPFFFFNLSLCVYFFQNLFPLYTWLHTKSSIGLLI